MGSTLFISAPSILSFLSLLLLLYTFIQWKSGSVRKERPKPGPTSYPILGCLVSFYNNRHRLLDWYTDMLSASPSQTIIISRFGARRTVVTANPHNVEYILKTNFTNFPKGRPFTEILGDFLGNGIFNVDGDLWYNQRKLVIHQFNPKSLRDYVDNILKEEVETKLIPVLESAADAAEAKSVDLQDLLSRLAFDLVCKVSLGFDPRCLDQYHLLGKQDYSYSIIDAFDIASDMCARRGAAPLSAIWKIKRFLNLGSEKKLREAVTRIHSFINEVVCETKKKRLIGSLTESSDLLSKLMMLNEKEDEFVRDTMISFIMAGRDTTSSAMTWLFYLLSCHSDVEHEVVRELGIVEDDQNFSRYESLKELRWLKACICESMRLFPPVAWDSKHAIENDVLPDGTRVRSGDRITYFPYGMGRMEGLWGEDGLEFKPERWVSDMEHGRIKALKNVGPYKFPVFQAGPRVCVGKEMAFIQMKFVVGSILKRFKIRPVNSNRPVFVPLLTAHMAGGFKVFVHRR
ncbi:Cytochrome P450 CYP4/CYP19/CYP26 subfamily [Handroanthus impetiginosus]|uniref:Cytochrome P450 CYP4/CYP19/CYP26 subfamily n=1 Tax=Handroanthus impetiginosus TaxID=429701 RepID=A0A2G9GXQ5_9LAMI|nr:Cytochrome P450 CYP4/CYP19/CYP26 subfamily [Handroanthus impetiginosus]